MFPASGHVTANAKPSATAASTALPPAFMISAAAALASTLLLTAIACGAKVAVAPAGRRHPSGNCAATRAGCSPPRGSAEAGVPRGVQAPRLRLTQAPSTVVASGGVRTVARRRTRPLCV